MKDVLLIGNGVNRLSEGISWGDLLNKLAGKPRTELEQKIRKEKPFTLLFDEIISQSDENEVKSRIANVFTETSLTNRFHKYFGDLSVSDILTTNYDYNIEESLSEKNSSANEAPESLYSLFRKRTANGKNIWHIHGEISSSRSIMLGHQQYNGYLHKIMSLLRGGVPTQVRERQGKTYKSKFSRKTIDERFYTPNWVDLFMGSNVHMIGFGFDYTENHLWYLIQEKRRLAKKFGPDIGNTYFHNCSVGGDEIVQSITEQARQSLLKSFGVEILSYFEDTYEASYEACYKTLKRKLK